MCISAKYLDIFFMQSYFFYQSYTVIIIKGVGELTKIVLNRSVMSIGYRAGAYECQECEWFVKYY